ncbi:permease [Clostridium botulinum Bf]|nr:permease [Clostridium botulinum Bf]
MIADLFITWLSTPVPARISPVADLFLSVTVAPAGIDAINVPNNSDLSV